jgi:hypothetical protein
MKFSMTGQEKCDLLIEMTSWAGLTVFSHSSTDDQYPERNLGVKIGSLLCWQSLLNFFYLLVRKSNLEKNSIYSNKFFHNF